MFANRMCLGSHGCGSPIVRSLRRRCLPMRFTSSTTAPFYNLRSPNAQEQRRRTTDKKKGGDRSPRPKASHLLADLLLALAQEEQVQERQERGQRRRYVGEGRRRQHALGTARLAVREDAVAGQ